MENQSFRRQFIDNGNKALFINITVFFQFGKRNDLLISLLQYIPFSRKYVEFQLAYQCSIIEFFV